MLQLKEEEKRVLEGNACQLVREGKGILAIDESPKSIVKKFAPLSIENTEENRRRYRELLLTAPKEISQYLGGVILNEETFFQKASDGRSLVSVARESGVLVGIKLDKGLNPLSETNPNEQVSIGLEGLSERCMEYQRQGASFAKWRSVFTIEKGRPSEECIYQNCKVLSEYALICQQNGLVPVVEPEVLFEGSHTAEECEIVTASVISCLFYHLNRKGVLISGMLLKLGFVSPGPKNGSIEIKRLANDTILAFRNSIPPSIPGIVFLSGGHAEDTSIAYLREVNRVGREKKVPWTISYSFGRALQDSVLQMWNNTDGQSQTAQSHLIKRARLCSEAVKGDNPPV
ncbi:fructose-bisphosphate aldolase, class I [Nematocida displodere]|uniref:fructose-bisphosphate aldolase n=1 Tax=Nematocida displodere TaxID=1805483 RepID=A0A177EAV3_9MICR|nr:fructose-bisphosphate aldolase, class I [Nematocida displodere]